MVNRSRTQHIQQKETETHQQRNQIYKLKEKIESTYYQVTQIEIDKRPRLQKLQNVFKIKGLMQTGNKAVEEILYGKDLNITQLNHLIYAAATVITEEINGTGDHKLETQRSKTSPWVRHIQESINDIRKELSALVEIKRGSRKAQNIKRTILLKKCNIEKKENLDQMIEELKQKVSAKTQRLSRYRKIQNQYYENKLFRTDCKKFYNCLRQTYSNVKNTPDKEEVANFWREIYGKGVQHNGEAHWIKNQYQQNPSVEWSPVCEKDVAEALRTTVNWKTTGTDQIKNNYYGYYYHHHLLYLFTTLGPTPGMRPTQLVVRPLSRKAEHHRLIPKSKT